MGLCKLCSRAVGADVCERSGSGLHRQMQPGVKSGMGFSPGHASSNKMTASKMVFERVLSHSACFVIPRQIF